MSVSVLSVGVRGAGAALADYITDEEASADISFFNLDELKADTKFEARTNAIAYVKTREKTEMLKRSNGRTHYCLILSWTGKEETEKAVKESHKFMRNALPKTKAIVSVHQNTDNTHSHILIDARQTDNKKIRLTKKGFYAIGERWTKQYDETYGTNFSEDYKGKKMEMLQYKMALKDYNEKKAAGIPVGDKPIEPKRTLNKPSDEHYREKEMELYLGKEVGEKYEESKSREGDTDSAAKIRSVGRISGGDSGTKQSSERTKRTAIGKPSEDGLALSKGRITSKQTDQKRGRNEPAIYEDFRSAVRRQLDKLNEFDSVLDQLEVNQKQYFKLTEEVLVTETSRIKTKTEPKPTRVYESSSSDLIGQEQPDVGTLVRHKPKAKAGSIATPAKSPVDNAKEKREINGLKPSVPEGQDAEKFGDLLVAEAKVSKAIFLLNSAKKDEQTRKHTITVAHSNGAKTTQKVSLKMLAAQKRAYASYELKMASESGAIDSNAKNDGVSKSEAAKEIYSEAHKEITNLQKPWKVEILKRNSQIIDRIKELHQDINKKYAGLQSETTNFAKETRPSPEQLWEAQLIAADSNNPELFSRLQKFHEEMNISRPDPVYSRLHGQNMFTHSVILQNQKRSELAKASQKVIITLRRDEETSESRIEGIRSAETEEGIVKEKRDVNRNKASVVSHDLLKSFSFAEKKPEKITGSLSWFTSSKPKNQVAFNPIEEIKKDPSIQFMQAAHSFINDLTEAQKPVRTIDQKFEKENESVNPANDYVKIHTEIQSATLNEESIRKRINLADPNAEEAVLTPMPRLHSEELEQIAITAEELRENNFTESYKTILKTNKNRSSELDETIRRNSSKSFLKAARASNLAKTAIEDIAEISDNELEITLDAALADQTNDLLEGAVYSDKIAFDLSEGGPVEFGPSAEDTESIVQYLEDTTPILSEFLENQIREQAQGILETYDPPSEQDKAVFESLQFNDEAQAQFDLHERSELQAAELYRKAEQAQDLVQPTMENHQNFTTYDSHEEADAKRAKSLQEDRAALDKQIDEDRTAGMSDAEIEKYREFEIKKAEFLEKEEAEEVEVRVR